MFLLMSRSPTPRAVGLLPLLLALASPSLAAQRPTDGRAFDRTRYLEDSAYTSANVSAGDVNGDGHLDLVLAKGRHWPLVDRVLLGDGRGDFSRAHDLGTASDRTYSALLADLDNDGDLDVVVSNDRPDPGLVHLNRGDGTFTVGSTWGEASWATRQVQAADVDGDGALDLIVANRSGARRGASYICRGTGDGRFASPCLAFADESSTSITPVDIDSDGRIDLIVPHRDGGQSHLYRQLGGHDTLAFERVPFGPADATIRLTAAADLNGDGRLDIVAIDEARGVFAFMTNADGTIADALPLDERTSPTAGTGRPYALDVADLDGDGAVDLVVGYVRRAAEVRYNDGTGRAFSRVVIGDAEGSAYGFAIADLDADGALDIAIARSEGRNVVHFGTPRTQPQPRRAGNPVLPGWYADPEAHVFAGAYWIHPTTSARYNQQVYLDAFSSRDLITWTKHPRIIDTSVVRWARRAMWAPSIVEKDGWYYLFFGANDIQNDSTLGGIGVARSRSPGGPFVDHLGKPLIDRFHNGAQPIDQMVFRDPASGDWYIVYGGWRHCNIARLNDDFTGFVPFEDGSLFKEITPEGYVEGAFMLVKDGRYYFMWSEGGWTGPTYAVAYAIGDTPYGPFRRIGKILQQDPEVATGAGHHSVLRAPSGNWYIVYHRRPLGETDRDHRVVSIDELRFDADGRIAPVRITHEGVAADPIPPPPDR